jgi:hypothetical protein
VAALVDPAMRTRLADLGGEVFPPEQQTSQRTDNKVVPCSNPAPERMTGSGQRGPRLSLVSVRCTRPQYLGKRTTRA